MSWSQGGTTAAPLSPAWGGTIPIGSGTWSTTGPLNTARTFQSATVLPGGNVLVTGGNDGSAPLSSVGGDDPDRYRDLVDHRPVKHRSHFSVGNGAARRECPGHRGKRRQRPSLQRGGVRS